MSLWLHVFLLPVLIHPVWTKSPQQEFAGLSAQERGSTPLSLQRQLAEKAPIVLNGRKQAFIDQTIGCAGAGPLLWNGKDGRTEAPYSLCAICAMFLHHLPHPITRYAVQEKGQPVATFCLPFSISNKLRPIHREGMLMCAAPGLLMEMPMGCMGQLRMRRENEALTP